MPGRRPAPRGSRGGAAGARHPAAGASSRTTAPRARAPRDRRRARVNERPRGGAPRLAAAVPALEGVDERLERRDAPHPSEPGGSSRPEPTSHASSASCSVSRGASVADLPERDAPLAVALEVRATGRGLRGVPAVEDERLGEVVAVRDREEPRPEVVVLALARTTCRSAARARSSTLAVDDDRRVEERRREERRPAHGARRPPASGGRGRAARRRRGRPSRFRRPPPAGPTPSAPRAARASREREVVGVHARDVPPASPRRGRR